MREIKMHRALETEWFISAPNVQDADFCSGKWILLIMMVLPAFLHKANHGLCCSNPYICLKRRDTNMIQSLQNNLTNTK